MILINSVFFQSSGFEYVESRRNIVTQGVELMWLIGREFQIGKARFCGQLLLMISVCGLPASLARRRSS